MMSKVFLTGKTFAETCAYVCQDLYRAEILDVEGVREYDLRLMAKDFAVQHRFKPEREKPVFHGMLSFPPGEDPGDEKMVAIAREFLQEIRMAPTQHVIVKHTDKAHLHLHIIANRVSDEGKIIGEGLLVERGIEAAQKLTLAYGLTPEDGKNLALTHLEALHEPDAKRYRLYQAIQRHLPDCRQLEDLEKRLQGEGITVRYRLNPVDGEREGISFRIENMAFAGYRVDKGCTLRNLERTLSLQLEQELKEGQALREREALEDRRVLREKDALREKMELREKDGVKRGEDLRGKMESRGKDGVKAGEDLQEKPESLEALQLKNRQKQGPRLGF